MIKNKERIRISKLRKMLAFSLVCLFFSLYWVRMKYLDEQFIEGQVETMQYEILDLDKQNKQLQHKIDSLQNQSPVLEKTKDKILINKKQVEKTKDSTLPKTIEYNPQGGSEMLDEPLSDTLNR